MRNLLVFVMVISIWGCCKKSDTSCIGHPFQLNPFVQTTTRFQCNGNNEYTYVFTKKEQVDSLAPNCFPVGPIAYPLDDVDFVYIILGRMSYHYDDTIGYTKLLKDTCAKKLTYEVHMIQRDTAYWSNGGGVLSVFCSVANIPANYQVEVKYKYVPLPE